MPKPKEKYPIGETASGASAEDLQAMRYYPEPSALSLSTGPGHESALSRLMHMMKLTIGGALDDISSVWAEIESPKDNIVGKRGFRVTVVADVDASFLDFRTSIRRILTDLLEQGFDAPLYDDNIAMKASFSFGSKGQNWSIPPSFSFMVGTGAEHV